MPRAKNDKERQAIINQIYKVYNSTEGMSIKEACAAVGISDGTYYNWRNKLKKDNSASTNTNRKVADTNKITDTEQKVINLKKDKPFLGFTKISKQLNYSYGIKVSAKKVQKILTKHGLEKTDYTAPKKQHPPRRFERLSRNEMWMMDIMYYRLKQGGRFYLISALDDYSRFITSHGVFKRQTIDNVIDILHKGIENRGAPTELLTDRGSQFYSWKGESRFRKLLDNLGIKHILASPQHPLTIGKLESFHRNIQRELLRQKHFSTIKEATDAIADYIEYYNHERVHMGLPLLTVNLA